MGKQMTGGGGGDDDDGSVSVWRAKRRMALVCMYVWKPSHRSVTAASGMELVSLHTDAHGYQKNKVEKEVRLAAICLLL